jgi:dephospho-CoA kinase
MVDEAPVITIDGPSGSGKGTISRAVAQGLGWHFLDSGALYRLVALQGLKQGLDPDDETGHARLAEQMRIRFGSRPEGSEQIFSRRGCHPRFAQRSDRKRGVAGCRNACRTKCPVRASAEIRGATRAGG